MFCNRNAGAIALLMLVTVACGQISLSEFGESQSGPARPSEEIASASNLSLSESTDTFFVTGSIDISSISDAPEGREITLYFKDTVLLRHSASLKLKGNGNFLAVASDIFRFISRGGGTWEETGRDVINESGVALSMTTFQSIPDNVSTPLSFDVVVDHQGEYDVATATFTLKQSGVYTFTAQVTTTVAANWASGDFCQLTSAVATALSYPSSNPAFCQANAAAVLTAVVGQQFTLRTLVSRAGVSNNVRAFAQLRRVGN